ncbi:MAG TPA: CHAT domain-containing protein [Pyrinomonadaceae bacterium]|nr:CHAT domain-containing protein [Pyrinomonadaceae bacterium]
MLTLNAHTASSDNFLTLFRRGFALLALLALLPAAPAAQNDKDTPLLEPGKPIERELAGDATHSYRITLAANQFLHVVVEQKGIDVVVALFAPDGKKVAEIDSPNGTQGPEAISVVTEAAGNYRLEVRSLEAKAEAGRYEVKIAELRTATEQDKNRFAAEQALMQAELLVGQGTAESLQSAMKKYEESLPLFRALGDRGREAVTLGSIGMIYDSLSDNQKALDYYSQALPLFRAAGDRPGEAAALGRIGSIYDSLGEKQKALDYHAQALVLTRAAGDGRGEAVVLNDIGAVYDSLGEKQKALDYYAQSLPLSHAAGDVRGEAITLANIGSVYNLLGEKQKALDHYVQALPFFRALGDRSSEATMLNNIGSVYDSVGETRKALDYYAQDLAINRALGDRRGEAATLNNIGAAYDSLNEKQKALDSFAQALALRRAVGDRRGEATTLNNIGVAYDSLNEKQKALDHYLQALPLSHAAGDRRGAARTLIGIGKVYRDLGEHQKALDHYTQSLSLIRAVGDRSGEAAALYYLAELKRGSGNLAESLTHIEATFPIVESLRTKIGSQELRSSYFATVQNYYEFYIDLLMQLHKRKPSTGYDGRALQASERGRARSLLETLAEANADIRQGADPALLERERISRQQLNNKAQQQMNLLSGKHTEQEAAAVAKEIERLTTEFQQVEAEIRQKSPRYAALTQPRPLSLREIQTQVLDRDTLLLEYSLGEERSYLWAVTPTSITSYELPKRAEIKAAAQELYELLTTPPPQAASAAPKKRELGGGSRRQAGAQLTQSASRLSRMLLGPVAPLLGKKRLLIVGDGALQYIPFAALPVPTGGAGTGADTPLVVEHEIVNLPSASTLAVLRREAGGRATATKTLAVLADPVFERSDERLKARAGKTESRDAAAGARADESRGLALAVTTSAKQSGVADADLGLPRLPGTRREAGAIARLVPPARRKEALDFAASRATATSPDLGQYSYVHFATHGFLNSEHPELSGIVLSMFDERGAAQDGFLRAHEVFNLKLSADVVTLSACQTGLGKEIRGEGLVGLTRGFMYAGAPRVVVSLWNVNDAATAELMTRFYRGMLRQRLRPAQALQAAQVSLLREKRFQSPYFWAAFTLQGEWR